MERSCRSGGSHSVSRVDKVPLASPRHTPPRIVHAVGTTKWSDILTTNMWSETSGMSESYWRCGVHVLEGAVLEETRSPWRELACRAPIDSELTMLCLGDVPAAPAVERVIFWFSENAFCGVSQGRGEIPVRKLRHELHVCRSLGACAGDSCT